jgi:hypothetical protein
MFPIIPILALIAIGGGGATLVWYDTLSREEKAEANRLANKYAADLFGKSVEQLTQSQAARVHRLVQGHFGN